MDFWNNPILVSTIRNRLRGGYMLHVLALYPVVLLMLGAAVPIFYPQVLNDWPHYGFVALMILQFAGSGLVATASASHSLKTEVVNQTLDFLRLTPLRPWQILVGKMLGEASLPFFAAVASLPVAVFCWAVGGTDILTLILLYINLLLYVLLCAAAGLTMRLELRDDKRVDSISALSLSGWMAAIPILSTLSMELPYRLAVLSLVPVLTVVMIFFILHVMARTLESPFNPPVSKAVAYGMLLAVDLGAAVAIALFPPLATGAKIVAFWGVHLAASAYVISAVTPWREVLRTWSWRFRGRVPAWRDAWLGNRSENWPAVLVDVLTGALVYGLVFLPVLYVVEGEKSLHANFEAIWGAPLLSSMLILTYGALFQWNSLIFGRSGNAMIVLFIACLIGPYYLGLIEEVGWIAQLSPFAHYTRWFGEKPEALNAMFRAQAGDFDMLPILLVTLGLVAVLARSSFRARMRYMARVVDRKLEKMGAIR
jgi:hypothetical protein